MTTKYRDLPDYLKPKNEIDALHRDLIDALSAWRITKEARYTADYHNIYHKLLSIGWDRDLDIDEMLPPDIMPDDYTLLYGRATDKEMTTQYRPASDNLLPDEKLEILHQDLQDVVNSWRTTDIEGKGIDCSLGERETALPLFF